MSRKTQSEAKLEEEREKSEEMKTKNQKTAPLAERSKSPRDQETASQ